MEFLFWIGLLLIFAPAALRPIMPVPHDPNGSVWSVSLVFVTWFLYRITLLPFRRMMRSRHRGDGRLRVPGLNRSDRQTCYSHCDSGPASRPMRSNDLNPRS
jgi:hypothetical protein